MSDRNQIIATCLKQAAPHNWLVHKLFLEHFYDAVQKFAAGRLLDIGCATKPWKPILDPHVSGYVGVDHVDSPHQLEYVDIVADAYDTTVEEASFDTVISTAVLEHLERPQDAINEMHRVLKPGGHAIISAPLFWHLHEEPRDFFRYTKYGLTFMFETAGFEVVEATPMSGFVVTFGQELCYFISYFGRRKFLKPFVRVAQFLIQRIAYALNKFDRSKTFTWAYLVVARKPESA